MIELENISGNILKVTVPEKLTAGDFTQIIPQIDQLIKQHGKIRLLLDASKFSGWEDMAAFEKHIGFIKTHHQKIERAAVIAGHAWQHWVVGTVRLFVHPEIHAFDIGQDAEALQWISTPDAGPGNAR